MPDQKQGDVYILTDPSFKDDWGEERGDGGRMISRAKRKVVV